MDPPDLLLLETHILEGCRIRERLDQLKTALFHPGPEGADEAILPDRRDVHPVGEDSLDLVQHVFALLAIHLLNLLGEECLDLGDRAVGVEALGSGGGLDPPRRGGAVCGCVTPASAWARCRPSRWPPRTRRAASCPSRPTGTPRAPWCARA